jgi:hypothetical protein
MSTRKGRSKDQTRQDGWLYFAALLDLDKLSGESCGTEVAPGKSDWPGSAHVPRFRLRRTQCRLYPSAAGIALEREAAACWLRRLVWHHRICARLVRQVQRCGRSQRRGEFCACGMIGQIDYYTPKRVTAFSFQLTPLPAAASTVAIPCSTRRGSSRMGFHQSAYSR